MEGLLSKSNLPKKKKKKRQLHNCIWRDALHNQSLQRWVIKTLSTTYQRFSSEPDFSFIRFHNPSKFPRMEIWNWNSHPSKYSSNTCCTWRPSFCTIYIELKIAYHTSIPPNKIIPILNDSNSLLDKALKPNYNLVASIKASTDAS